MKSINDVILLEDRSHLTLGTCSSPDGVVSSKPLAEQERISKKLVVHDILMIEKKERERMIPLLSEEYGINFLPEIEPVPNVITFTSRKGIIRDTGGRKYFLKEKPEYSLINESHLRSALVQNTLARSVNIVPEIIPNQDGEPYGIIGTKTFLLTPYIEGTYFTGKLEESTEAAKALGLLHSILANNLEDGTTIVSAYNDACFFIELASKLDFVNKNLHEKIISGLREMANKYRDPPPIRVSWLHGDFTPFNLIYKDGTVVGINDFDNVSFGAISRDLGECILKHTGICYAGTTSSFRAPIPRKLDEKRMKVMLQSYLSLNHLEKEDLYDLGYHAILIWIESLSLGLVRGDYTLQDIEKVLSFGPIIFDEFSLLSLKI